MVGRVRPAYPAFSSASQAHSRKIRCCGSTICASRGDMPKNPASKFAAPSSAVHRRTKFELDRMSACYAGGIEVRIGRHIETFDAVRDIAPKSVEVISSRKAAGETDDRDGMRGHLISHEVVSSLALRLDATRHRRPRTATRERPAPQRSYAGTILSASRRSQIPLQCGMQLDHQHRMSADIEEVVVQRNAIGPQDFRP